MNTKAIFVVILMVVAGYCEAKENGGDINMCNATELCSKFEVLKIELNQVSSEGKANNEALQKQIDDLTNELEDLKLAPTTKPPFVCNDPWVEFQSSCYLFTDVGAYWADAISECKKHDAKLVSIKSEEENNFVQGHVKGNSWLSLNDEANEGSWIWSSDGSALGYRNWDGGEPNGGRAENYVMFYWSNGKWNDTGPNHELMCICQKE